jgi:two-component system LytT family sensor kinase
MKNRAYHPFTNRTAILLSLLIGTVLNAIMSLGYIYSKDREPSADVRTVCIFVTNIILLYLLYTFCFKTVQLKINKTSKFCFLIGESFLIASLLSFALSKFFFLLISDSRILVNEYYTTNLIKDLILSIIVLFSTFLLNSVSERQQTLLENEKLIAENLRIRYEVLKSQVDPHFLFNSLNTLNGLIVVDADKSQEFVQNLSSVFRYAIGNKEVTYLEEELDFTESYGSLMKIRYGNNLQIIFNINEKYKTYHIMPISLQLLVENAIKHNIISDKKPLIITIETTSNDTIRVLNNIQPKHNIKSGHGIGLANIAERYRLLFQKEVTITQTDVFCVELPLIKQPATTKS